LLQKKRIFMLPYPTDSNFPEALKVRREMQGMSRAALARAAGIHEVMPRRYEEPDCGEFTRPRPDSTWLALNRALGYEIRSDIDEVIEQRESMRTHGLPGSPPLGSDDGYETGEPVVSSERPAERLLKDASLEEIVKLLHGRHIEPTFRHLMAP
jgi:transcriptional regulator with XRE-family HTH domain